MKISGLVEKLPPADPVTVGAMRRMAPMGSGDENIPLDDDLIIDLPLHQIFSSPFQVRTLGDDEAIASLKDSIAATGLNSPIVVRPIATAAPGARSFSAGAPADQSISILYNGTVFTNFELISGEHRALAVSALGHPRIKAIVRWADDKTAATRLASDNNIVHRPSDFDLFLQARLFRGSGFYTMDSEIAKVLNVSKTQMSFLWAFADLPDEAIDLLRLQHNLIGATVAYKIREISKDNPAKVVEGLRLILNGKLKQSALPAWLSKIESKKSEVLYETYQVSWEAKKFDVRVSKTEATVMVPGLNPEKLTNLIAKNLADLLS